jgi:hypothetical protein
MLHPSIESTNPPVALANASRALPPQTSDSVRDSAVAVLQQAREEERSLPVCAARWAY